MLDVANQTGLLAQQLQGLVDDYVTGKIEFLLMLDALKATGASANEAQDDVSQALARRSAGVTPSAATAGSTCSLEASSQGTSISGGSSGPLAPSSSQQPTFRLGNNVDADRGFSHALFPYLVNQYCMKNYEKI
jgi:hypothetical protein